MVMEMMIITIDLAYKFLAEIKIDLSDEKINVILCSYKHFNSVSREL